MIFVLVPVTELFNYFYDESILAIKDEIFDPGVKLHPEILKGDPSLIDDVPDEIPIISFDNFKTFWPYVLKAWWYLLSIPLQDAGNDFGDEESILKFRDQWVGYVDHIPGLNLACVRWWSTFVGDNAEGDQPSIRLLGELHL